MRIWEEEIVSTMPNYSQPMVFDEDLKGDVKLDHLIRNYVKSSTAGRLRKSSLRTDRVTVRSVSIVARRP